MATNEEFLSTIKEGCIQGWRDHAVLASISGAQAILESNWGKSTLALKANNLFGIKGDYNGASLTVETKEFIDKVFKIVEATFRKYSSWSESITDHSAFFTSTEWRKTNYAAVVGETDYKKAAAALSAAGYATDPDYPAKLIKLIEAYDLAAWDEIKEETTMAYEIDYRLINYSGRKTTTNKYIIAHESGNPNNVGANSLEGEVKYMQGQAAQGGAFTSHWVGSGGKIVQIAPVGYIQYGAGGIANPLSYAQVELARTNNAETFKKDYAAYVWLLRMLAAECGIPQTLDKTGNGIKTHLWVTNNLGNTTHVDPYGYLNSWGISNAQFASDIANGLETADPVAKTGNLVYVDYDATIIQGGYSVDSKPWGEPGFENWSNTTDWMYKTIHFREENASREYANGDYFGWVDKRALGKARKNARYTATVVSAGFSIDSLPWGEDGYYQLGLTDNHVYSVVTVLMESLNGEYAYIRNDEKEIGWVDKRALAEGVVAKPEVAPEPEPAAVAAVLHLPGGNEWVMYPSDGPYQAGDVISLEDAAAYTVLGERNGGKVLIVELENFGVVGIRFDKDKGAKIV